MNAEIPIRRLVLVATLVALVTACGQRPKMDPAQAQRLLDAGRPDQVVAGLSGQSDPSPETLRLLAQAFSALPGREEEAALALAPAARSGNPDLVLLAARAALAADRLGDAETWLKNLLSAQPGALEPAIEYAKLLAIRGRYEESVALLRRFESEDPRILNLIGYSELLSGNPDKAREALHRAVDIADRAGRPYAPPHYHLGLDHASRGEWKAAKEEFRAAAMANPNHLEAHYQWLAAAEILGAADEIPQAREGFARLYRTQLKALQALDQAPESRQPLPVERTIDVESRVTVHDQNFQREFPAGAEIEVACLAPRGAQARFRARIAGGAGQPLLDVIHQGNLHQDVWIPHRLRIPGSPGGTGKKIDFDIAPASFWSRIFGGSKPKSAAFSEPGVINDPSRRSHDARPNILLISLDTLRADHVGSYGAGHPTTPFLDGLAAKGTRFARCEAASNWTLPSHYSMLSGLTPEAHGVNPGLEKVRGFIFPDRRLAIRGSGREVMLAEALAEAGYRTAGITENGWVSARFGFDQGFRIYRSDLRGSLPATRAAAMAELEAFGTAGPWFLFVHTYTPHQPYHAPFSWRTRFGDPSHIGFAWPGAKVPIKDYNRFHGELFGPAPSDVRAFRDLYDGQAAWSDTLVGDLAGWLESKGLMEQTVVVVTSDHGEEIFERGQFDHGDTLYEEVTHVPLIMVGSGRLPQGRVVNETVSQIDLPATLLDLAGCSPKLGEGETLRPFWEGKGRLRPAFSQAVGKNDEPLAAVWEGNLKYTRRQTASGVREQLFDLAKDPGEKENLGGRRKGDLIRLRLIFEEHRDRAAILRKTLGTFEQTVDQGTIDSLRSLGYAK